MWMGLVLSALSPLASPPQLPALLRVPILMYHRIGDPEPGAAGLRLDLVCPRSIFQAHLRFLRESGYTSVTFRELQAALQGTAKLPRKPIVLTFDDGLESHWFAFRDLEEAGMKGVFFVVSGKLDEPGRLRREQVRAMANGGMDIGSHSATHADLRALGPAEREREIAGSKHELEALLGRPVLAFAYPGGSYDLECLPILAAAGYVFARTTAPGIAAVSLAAFELETVPVWHDTDSHRLEGKLARLGKRDAAP
jgi:peptidoglycan/xylan/chitin deacetylase (PgdA/CDA1 family)